MKNSNKDERILDISSQARMTNTSIVDIEGIVAKTINLNTAQEELKELSKNSKKVNK